MYLLNKTVFYILKTRSQSSHAINLIVQTSINIIYLLTEIG